MAATNAELKQIIIDLRVQLFAQDIPEGTCPYECYALVDKPIIECTKPYCGDCINEFFDIVRRRITKEVEQL